MEKATKASNLIRVTVISGSGEPRGKRDTDSSRGSTFVDLEEKNYKGSFHPQNAQFFFVFHARILQRKRTTAVSLHNGTSRDNAESVGASGLTAETV